jgi:RNA polymerase sigma-70 factor (ECF subfamily)
MNHLDDEQLLRRVTRGDTASFEALYDRYAPAVMGVALRITGDRALAEEAVQEAFWRVWRNAASFQAQRGTVAGWLFGITRNVSIDLCRRRKVQPQPLSAAADSQYPIEQVSDPAADVPEAAWAAIQHQQVQAALTSLPPEQRRVIDLAYFGGLTHQQIATTLGEPLGTVHTRARLALRKLRETLQARGFEH